MCAVEKETNSPAAVLGAAGQQALTERELCVAWSAVNAVERSY